MTLTLEPLISFALWLSLMIASLGLLGWYAWNRPWGLSPIRWGFIVFLMALSMALPLAILLNPTWQERIPPPAGKPQLTILVDVSASMAATDMPEGKTRFQVAAKIAQACATDLIDRFEIKAVKFAETALPTDIAQLANIVPKGRVTDIAAAINATVEPNRPAGQALLLLSDGNHNTAGGTNQVLAATALARTANAAIFTKTLGTDAEVHDLSLRVHSPQQLSFIGQAVPVAAFVKRRGKAPQAVTVVLEHEGQELERQQLFLATDAETEIRFQVRQSAPGLYRYEMHVVPFEGEVTEINNYSTLLLRVVNEPIRVLLVEGKPYWDSKFLMRTLSSDRSIELVSLIRMSENRFLERTLKRTRSETGEDASNPPIDGPVTEAWRVVPNGADILADATALAMFQVVVLGRDSEIFLGEQALDNLRNWITSESGSLVCSRGQPMSQINERLDRLLPVHWDKSTESRFRMTLTDRGRDLRWFESQDLNDNGEKFPRLPTLATSTSVSSPRPLATVLATVAGEANDKVTPVVTYQPYGGGRVVVVEGAGMWRWAFLPPAYAEHDVTFGSLWQSLLRWLVSGAGLLPGEDMALRTDQVTFGDNDPATATLLVRREVATDQIPNVELTGGSLEDARTIVPTASGEGPGVFRVVFGALSEGRYSARLIGRPLHKSGNSTEFDVRKSMGEELDMSARPDLMCRISNSTGGIELGDGTPREIAEAFKSHLQRGHTEQIRRTSAWDQWWVMLGTLAIWATAWAVRRNAGLV